MKHTIKIFIAGAGRPVVKQADSELRAAGFIYSLGSTIRKSNFVYKIKNFDPSVIIISSSSSNSEYYTKSAAKILPDIPSILLTDKTHRKSTPKNLSAGNVIISEMEKLTEIVAKVVLASGKNKAKRKKAELTKAKKRAGNSIYKTFIDQSSEGIYRLELTTPIKIALPTAKQAEIYRKNAYFAECNNMFAKMYGFKKASEVIGKKLSEMPDANNHDNFNFEDFIRAGYQSSNVETFERDVYGNEKFFLNSLTGIIERGKLVRIWGTQKDISDIKKVGKALEQSEQRFKAFFDNSVVGIYQSTLRGKLTLANDAFVRMLGYSSFDEIAGKNASEVGYKNKAQREKFLKRFENNDAVMGLEYELIRKDGTIISVRESSKATRDPKGNILFLQGILEDITEKKKFESALLESEEKFSVLSDTAPIMIWIAGEDKLCYYFNKLWLDFTGRSLKQESGYGWFENIHPDDREGILTGYLDSFNARQEMEFRLKNKEGQYRWILGSAAPRFINKGTFAGYIGSFIDITDRRTAEEALKESEELYRSVVNNIHEGLLITDIGDKILFANRRMAEMSGYPMDEIIGKTGYKLLMNKKYWSLIISKNKSRFSKKTDRYEVEMIRKDGTVFWSSIHGAPYADSSGKIIGTIGAITDISERKKAERVIRESEEKYRGVVQSVREIIFRTDDNGAFTFLNPSWSELTGYDAEKSLGEKFNNFLLEEDRKKYIDEFVSLIYKRKEYSRFEIRLLTSSGTGRWIEVSARLMYGEGKKISGISGTISDVHERKLAEEELIKSKEKAEESDRLKSVFLAQVSHEIRTPLHVMMSYNSLIEDEIGEKFGTALQPHFKAIERGGKRLLRTIDLILNMSIAQTDSYEPLFENINLNKLLWKLINEFKLMAEENNLSLALENKSENPIVRADEYTVSHALQNLIDNALKYTEKGGVKIVVRNDRGKNLCVDISDTGIGISKSYLPFIFEPFSQEESGYSRRFDGNGLGLALTKKYVELNNAEISVKSEKRKGTVFTIKFIGKK